MAANILKHIPGEKRRYAFNFAAQPEITPGGETLTGTPTLTITPATAFTITSVVISGSKVLAWIESTTAAALGDRIAKCTVATSAGATLIEYGTLKVQDH